MLNELPGVERIKLKYQADDTMTEIIGRHATTSLVFDEYGKALRDYGKTEGWQHLDEIGSLFSKGLDHLPKKVGDDFVLATSDLMYYAVWKIKEMFDENGHLTSYGVTVIASAVSFVVKHPWKSLETIASVIVYGGAYFSAVVLYEIAYELVEKIVAMVVDTAVEIYQMAVEAAEKFKQFVAQKLREFKEWCQKTFNAGYKYASQHTCIQIDTDKMRQYGAILREVNRKLNEIDRRMDRLYRSLKLGDQAKLMRADIRTGYSLRLGRCASYLEDTASEFATVESNLIKIL